MFQSSWRAGLVRRWHGNEKLLYVRKLLLSQTVMSNFSKAFSRFPKSTIDDDSTNARRFPWWDAIAKRLSPQLLPPNTEPWRKWGIKTHKLSLGTPEYQYSIVRGSLLRFAISTCRRWCIIIWYTWFGGQSRKVIEQVWWQSKPHWLIFWCTTMHFLKKDKSLQWSEKLDVDWWKYWPPKIDNRNLAHLNGCTSL